MSESSSDGVRLRTVEFVSAGQRVRGDLVIPSGTGPHPGIVKYHGLPGSADQVSGIATRLAQAGFVVLTFDFRGVRRSEGVFSLRGQIEDARNSVSFLLDSELCNGWVGVYGASFGGAVAICSAARDSRVRAVAVRAPVYDTLRFAESGLLRVVMEEVSLYSAGQFRQADERATIDSLSEALLSDARVFNPIHDISDIAPRPLFVTTGTADTLIDLNGVRSLFDLAGEPKRMFVVDGATHNLDDMTCRTETEEAIKEWFLESVRCDCHT
ncbi:MAG: alpha/beta fold hydrolase [Candidatus Thorarchaeota archaeon]|nr:alpha/beta fold hydrolase [Candidatus Thorarchaeota archaeon]